MIRVIATLQAREGHTQSVKDALVSLVAPTRREADCVSYELAQSEDAPEEFVTVEEWRSAEGLAAHMKTAHVLSALLKAAPLLAAAPQIKKYQKVE